MQKQSDKLFRQESLERLSSPEQLDQLMQVVNPKAWLPLTTIGLLITTAATWSVVGRIPLTVNGQAVIIRPRNVVPFQIGTEGVITTLNIKPGDKINKGQIIGTIEQPQLKQQLQQAKSKLAELQAQNQKTTGQERQSITLQRENLIQQRAVLQDNLRNTKAFGPILLNKGLKSLVQKRESLKQDLQRSKALLPTLQQRLNIRRSLRQEKAISEDLVLQSQQELSENLTKVSELETQLKDIDRQESEAQAEYLKHLNSIKEVNNQIQTLQVQESQIAQQDLEKTLDRNNKVQETKRQIAQIELELAKKSKILSSYNGRILEISTTPGQAVSAGSRLASIEIEDSKVKLMSVIYFADKDGKQVKPGMTVQVTPSMVKRERFGGIVGKITNVTPFPVTNQDMTAVIGNEHLAESIVQSLSSGGSAPVQIFAELQEDPTTVSGYKWSSSVGPPIKISSGTTAQVRVQIGQQAPISYVIPIFRSLTGVY